MNTRTVILGSLVLFTVVRWIWLLPQDLSPSASYLALCGYNPAVAYFDGPGATSVCVALGTQWAGASALGAALLWPVFAALATFALYVLVAGFSGARAALASAVLLNLLPVFNTAALTPTCAMPVLMFALAFLACAWRGLETGSPWWWLASGLCAAGGLLFDYLAWFFWPALIAAMLASHRWRPRLLEPGIWLATLPALAVFFWLLVWNSTHGWVHFIGGTWQTATSLDFRTIPRGIYQSAVAASPLVLVALAAGLLAALRDVRLARSAKFLAIPAMIAALIAVYIMLRSEPAQAAGLLAAALAIPLLGWLPLTQPMTTVLFASASLWTAGYLAIKPMTRASITQEGVQQIEEMRRAKTTDPAAPVFLIARDAALASALAMHLQDTSFVAPGHPPVYVLESPYADSQYAFWPRYDQFVDAPAPQPPTAEPQDPFTEQDGANPFLGRSALYITTQSPDQLPQAITAAFATHRLLAEVTTGSGETLRVYLCQNYETLPL
jgi:hypothetical protein